MAFSHPYGAYSVEGTLNKWFQTNLTAPGVPAWMPSAQVRFDWPERPLFSGYSGHVFTVTHLGAPEVMTEYQGRNTVGGSAGTMMTNLIEVDCWVNKAQAGEQYPLRLRQMGDMVTRLFGSTVNVQLTNIYTGTGIPTAIGALIRVRPAQGQVVAPDPNPDIRRRRFVASYFWLERA
jgi:hypothetical protein